MVDGGWCMDGDDHDHDHDDDDDDDELRYKLEKLWIDLEILTYLIIL